MTLFNLEFRRLLPAFMRGDIAILSLSQSMDTIFQQLATSILPLSTWDYIDDLGEAELDELAWELNILWWNSDADIETKREIVKTSDMVYKKLGTKWAVEKVITAYFGDGYIREWFQYSGEPGHFRVYSTNPSITEEKLNQFLDILYKVKRSSAILDGISITLTGEMKLSAGFGIHQYGTDAYVVQKPTDL